jgi:two-component system phosphate regulon response regulator PhoB
MAKTKVLVIEDDRSLAEVLVYNLKQAGYEVQVATDGQDGLLQAQIKSPDMVILDLMLPVVDGLDVCRRLRADNSTNDLLIVMLTAKADPIDSFAFEEQGAPPDHEAYLWGNPALACARLLGELFELQAAGYR